VALSLPIAIADCSCFHCLLLLLAGLRSLSSWRGGERREREQRGGRVVRGEANRCVCVCEQW